jgi:transcriptional regulator with XRE-family HTH domain
LTGYSKSIDLIDIDVLDAEISAESSEAHKLWMSTEQKRKIALLLSRLRKMKGLSQKEIAQFCGWDKSFVSRLESSHGSIPDAETISRYAAACGITVGIIFNTQIDADHIHVIDAMTLPSPKLNESPDVLERLRETDIALPASDVAVA